MTNGIDHPGSGASTPAKPSTTQKPATKPDQAKPKGAK